MRIAVDTTFWQSDATPALTNFTREVFGRLVTSNPEHQFIFLTAAPYSINKTNVTVVTITPKPANFLSYKLWYDVKLPLTLLKYKADLFIATYGVLSLTTSVPQLIVVRDLAFLQKELHFTQDDLSYRKRYSSRFMRKAKKVVTLSDFVKKELETNYLIANEVIQVIGSGAEDFFKRVEWEQREVIKEKFAEGYEYFVFPVSISTHWALMNVLKAFSIFKKWQKSNMKLIVTGKPDGGFEKELEKLNSYKYRSDVFIKSELEQSEIAKVFAAAYAIIFPAAYEGFAEPILEAMKCEVPVITTPGSSVPEIADDAALYADPAKPEQIAEQMKLIYKDEQLRNKLIEASKQRAKLFDWDQTAALLWKAIEEVVSK